MATISKRTSEGGEVSYQVRVRIKGYPEQIKTFARITDAKRWANKTETDIREGLAFPDTEAKRRTVGELIDRYLADVLPGKRSESNKANQRAQLEWWRGQIGDEKLADVTPDVIARCRSRLTCGPSTRNKYCRLLSHGFKYAVEVWGWSQVNPVKRVPQLKEPRGRARFLSVDERKALLKTCKASNSPYLYMAVVVALSTGMRQAEQLSLTWDRVGLEAGVIILE